MASEAPLPSLLALAELLSGPREENEEEDEPEQDSPLALGNLGPGHIGAPKIVSPAVTSVKFGNAKEIWDVEEVPEGSEYDDSLDSREQPEYEILFKQQVGAEDLFLGINGKDPSTACCEDMVIKIKLPDTTLSDITLDIKEKVLDLRSPQKKLLLHLPHPVDPNSGRACFLSEKDTLEVTLRMRREFDFINFA